MTCIAAIRTKDGVCMAADSAGVAGYEITHRADSKIFKNKEMIFSFTSSFRMGQILRYDFVPPKHPVDMDDYEYMVRLFIKEVRKALKTGGYTSVDKNEESGGRFLVGYRGLIFHIESDFQVGLSVDEYDADGCGDEYAKGALFTLIKRKDITPEKKLEKALDAAAYHSAAVCAPYETLTLSGIKRNE